MVEAAALDEAAELDWGHQRVFLGVGLAWAASRTCEERFAGPPGCDAGDDELDWAHGVADLTTDAVLESGLTTLATALGGVRRWRQADSVASLLR